MNKIVINTFSEGMNKDIDKSMLSDKSYLDAQNFRMITTKGSSTGSLETIKGNKLIVSSLPANQYIVGSCEIRDKIILFTTNNTSTTPNGGISRIYSLLVNLETETQTSLTMLYDDNLNVDGSYLNFSVAYPIKAVSRYESPNIQKVYWTDGYNNIRYVNIADNLTTDGEVYSGSGDYMSIDKFEFLPNFVVSKPTLKNVVTGKLTGGIVAYSYQLYTIHGAETAFSPLSDPIHVVTDSDTLFNTLLYKGDSESVNTGKGFVMQIDNTSNLGYDRLRLVRVHYTVANSTPRISISNEIEISKLGSIISVTDIGDTLGELTIDEFNIASTELFKCQDISTKDNRLFVSNISKSDFIVDDWDARAVRFKYGSGGNAVVYDGVTPTTILGNLSNWDSVYPINHDGINKFNDPQYDGNTAYEWKYQADSTILGAEGKNIKIDFETEVMTLDNSPSPLTFYTTSPSSGTDKSYTNYASPWKGGKLSWQRDEVYRLFVVFGNDRGQVADPKWICDLRMPSLHDSDFINGSSITCKPSVLLNYGLTYRLYPRVYFKNFPANATYAQIYRIKRERNDKSVVTQGLVIPSSLDGSTYHPKQVSSNTLPNNGQIFKLVSPEINIKKDVSKQSNDYIQYVTNYSSLTVTDIKTPSSSSYKFGEILKFHANTRVPFTTDVKATINDAITVSPAINTTEIITLDSKQYNNYERTSGILAKGSSGLLIAYSPNSWSAEIEDYVIVNYKSNVFGSQYGGNTYEDRQINISIPCSDVIRTSDINTWVDVSYGDTFINYFDVSTLLADLNASVYQDTWSETVYVALESSVNCDLRHDVESAHNYITPPSNYQEYTPSFRQEYAGTYTLSVHGTDRSFVQSKDLYLYNQIYSQQVDVKYAISFVVDKILETEFDSMIKASGNKSNGEISDSWTSFGVNEFIEVDSIYGPVNAITNFNNRLFYFQDKAFGLLAINDRSLITDNASAQLVLGTGGVLDRYEYVSTVIGCSDKFSITNSTTGMFWFDRLSKSLYRFSNSLLNLTKAKYIQSYMDNTLDPVSEYKVISHADIANDEILFTFFKENETNGFTISFNELVDAFISFYGFVPIIYVPYKHRYFTTTNSYYCDSSFNMTHLFLHDSNDWDRCYFYALNSSTPEKYVNSTLELLFNPEYQYTKVFDNIFYISNTASKTTMNNPVKTSNIDIFTNTFNSIQCYNDFQNTGEITLTYKTNIERRERGWTLVVPRNIVSSNISNNPNIFTNVDSTQLFKERMRDKYLIAYFTYNNDGTYDRFTVSNMGLKYRTSYR